MDSIVLMDQRAVCVVLLCKDVDELRFFFCEIEIFGIDLIIV